MTTTTETVRQLPIEAIVPDPANRKVVLDKQFVDSIRTHGVIQPLLVTPHAEKQGAFDLVAGHRRLAAARKVGLGAVPAIVRELTDQQKLELALVDNLQRADLSPPVRRRWPWPAWSSSGCPRRTSPAASAARPATCGTGSSCSSCRRRPAV